MSSQTRSDAGAPCVCGSGLTAARCCDDESLELGSGPDMAPIRAWLREGEAGAAERALIEALETGRPSLEALLALHDIRASQGRARAAEALLRRIVRLDPNQPQATQALALMLFTRGALAEAERHARDAVRIAPLDAQSHNLMGMIMTEAQRPHVGEHHYRRARELLAEASPILLANLAWNLKNQGRMAESRSLYEQSVALDPKIFQTLHGWARMEETDRNFERAASLLDAAEALSPGNSAVMLQRAVLRGRVKDYTGAVATLAELERRNPGGLGPLAETEKGLLLDKIGRHPEAFAAFSEGKRKLRAMTGLSYREEDAAALARRLKDFFTEQRLRLLPRAATRRDVPQPLFIVGFPRSGTTMIEQTLSAHPRISAGDELPVIGELTALLPRMLNSPLPYPSALADLWLGDQREGLDNARDYYLQRARQLGALREGASRFTDKMPLNETHLGLISLMFPEAPIIHLLRHPLDVVLSVFSHHLTHGFLCAYDLTSIAKHYLLVMDLVEHYLREVKPRYLAVRYEDVIDNQEKATREMLGFIGEDFDPRCLAFHENRRYARTASYAQVSEKLYDRSRYRYRNYREPLAPVIPMLTPIIERLGYALD